MPQASCSTREFASFFFCRTQAEDGTYALSGGQDRIVRLWNPHTGNVVKEYAGAHGYEIADIAVCVIQQLNLDLQCSRWLTGFCIF
jgi:hypothetical protein